MQGRYQTLGSSGMDLGSLGSRFGLSPEQTKSAMSSLVPAITGGFQKTVQSGNLAGVENAAARIDQPGAGASNDILDSKNVSREVADHAAGQSDVSSQMLKAMLPVVAAMAAKHMAGSARLGSAGGGGLGSVLGSLAGFGAAGGLGRLLGGGGAGINPLDDILERLK